MSKSLRLCSFGILALLPAALSAQNASAQNASAQNASANAAPSAGYTLAAPFAIGGPGRWDYVVVGDDHKLYVTRSTHTQVIDGTSGKVIADIAGGSGLHGTALAPSAGRGFVTDGKDAKLLVFDLKTNAMLGKIDAADDADGIIYSPGDDRVLVSCGDASALLVLDPKADVATAKVEKIDLGGKPEFLAADGHGHVFVNLEDKDEVAAVDLKTMKVTDRWKLGKGTGPAGLAIDAKHGRLFVGCHNSEMVVLDTADGHVLAELPIGNGNDACAFDDGTAFASCNDATMTLVKETSPGQFAVTATVKTAQGARTMAIDPTTHAAYLPTSEFEPATAGQRRPTAKPDSFKIIVAKRSDANSPAGQ